ncbi:OmpH family outer membrane protein [Polaribacter batillariae]|uniref:OmpH family outer membrane protein n=1 Tax=Polaribacter batillariae TaxID=2808900 RepID=A0ABX7SV91_9FLAO|nr:OmpH family outer membrane protein [Polaribacter batillariae]QTD38096.1 OmpH family outer membrane protein [Polaribacter batillariae]
MKFKIILFLIAFSSIVTVAQTKVGTINSDYIINIMPEAKTVVEMTQAYGAKLDSSFNVKLQDYKAKIEDYKAKEKEMGELLKKTTQKELMALDKDIQKYQKNGTALMQLKREELMRPLYKKLSDAITEVAKANGYTQILTTSGNEFAYIDEQFDITKLVITKLGIAIPKQTQE